MAKMRTGLLTCGGCTRQMLSVLTKIRPDMPVAHMQINRGTRHLSVRVPCSPVALRQLVA